MVTRINNRHLKITTVRLLPVPTYTAFLSAVTCPLLSGSSMTSPRLQPTQTLSHTLTPSLSHTQRRVTEFMYTLHCQAIFSPQPGKSHYRQLYFSTEVDSFEVWFVDGKCLWTVASKRFLSLPCLLAERAVCQRRIPQWRGCAVVQWFKHHCDSELRTLSHSRTQTGGRG